jgi:putative SOS response-associated peptidase YedK
MFALYSPYRWSRSSIMPFHVRSLTDCHDSNRFSKSTSTLSDDDQEWTPHYNIAPTQLVPVIRQNPKEPARVLSLLRWGLIPSWSKDSSCAAQMINARSETVNTQPAFRDAFKLRRCLIPADGFYEWKRDGKIKQPYCFEVDKGEMFAFAGLWDRWKNPAGEWIKSCSILTTTPNTVAAGSRPNASDP